MLPFGFGALSNELATIYFGEAVTPVWIASVFSGDFDLKDEIKANNGLSSIYDQIPPGDPVVIGISLEKARSIAREYVSKNPGFASILAPVTGALTLSENLAAYADKLAQADKLESQKVNLDFSSYHDALYDEKIMGLTKTQWVMVGGGLLAVTILLIFVSKKG